MAETEEDGWPEPWTWRDHLAHWIHQFAFLISKPVCHDLLVRNSEGVEIFSIGFEGGFVASGPPEPYTLHCRHYEDDDDLEGTVHDL